MMFPGQLVQNVTTGKFAVFAGVHDFELHYFTPEFVQSDEYTHVEDETGEVVIGGCTNHEGWGVGFFGCVDPELLDDKDKSVIQEICERPAQPVRPDAIAHLEEKRQRWQTA